MKILRKISPMIMAAILIIIDQLIKAWAITSLKAVGTIEWLPGVMNLTYVENTGAAFGILSNNTVFLAIVSSVFLAVILFAVIFGKVKDSFLKWTLMVIFAGGLGNVIDRFARGFVVDYFDIQLGFLKSFPVFNFADCCVTIGAVLLIVYVIKTDVKKEQVIE